MSIEWKDVNKELPEQSEHYRVPYLLAYKELDGFNTLTRYSIGYFRKNDDGFYYAKRMIRKQRDGLFRTTKKGGVSIKITHWAYINEPK